MCVFFFQAEDGIRDLYVTGVQTCALPIWQTVVRQGIVNPNASVLPGVPGPFGNSVLPVVVGDPRSEERRVGKECRSRWSVNHQKKKKKPTRTVTTLLSA